MDHAGHGGAVFRPDGHHITAAPHRDDGILQHLLVGRRAQHLVELVADPLVAEAHGAADGGQLRRGVVVEFILREHAALDLLLQKAQAAQVLGVFVEDLQRLGFRQKRGAKLSGGGQEPPHSQKLPAGQSGVHPGFVHLRADVVEGVQGA